MSNNIQPEIDDLLEGYRPKTEDSVVDEPTPEEPVAEEPTEKMSEPETKEPDVEEEITQEPEPQEEGEATAEPDQAKDSEDPGEADSELEQLKKQNELLQQRLNEAYEKRHETPPAKEPETPQKPDFFGNWQYEDIIDNEESFKKFLGAFAEKVRGYTEESVSQRIPSEVSRISSEQIDLQKRVDAFYQDHTALDAVRPFVAEVTGRVTRENPTWTANQVLEETAKRSYEALGLSKEVVQEPTKPKAKPAFATTKKAGSRGNIEPEKDPLQKEIEDLLDL